jgi:hypothetical protein
MGWYIYSKRDCMEPGKRLYLRDKINVDMG